MTKDIKISDAELKVLDVIWKEKSANSKRIADEVQKKETWNRKTIHTLLKRLVEKGAVNTKKQGNIYIYTPNISKAEYQKKESKSFLKKIYNGSLSMLMTNFIEDEDISEEELDKLYELLDNKKTDRK